MGFISFIFKKINIIIFLKNTSSLISAKILLILYDKYYLSRITKYVIKRIVSAITEKFYLNQSIFNINELL